MGVISRVKSIFKGKKQVKSYTPLPHAHHTALSAHCLLHAPHRAGLPRGGAVLGPVDRPRQYLQEQSALRC